MKTSIYATLAVMSLALPATAQDGDATKGQKEFNKCKACHMIQAPDGTDIVKGGKTGPNLYGVVGRKIASAEGFKYGDGILEVAEKNPDLTWSEADLIEYVTDPKPWLVKKTDDSAVKTKMTFKLNKNQADVVAFLAEHSPDAGAGSDAAPAETPVEGEAAPAAN